MKFDRLYNKLMKESREGPSGIVNGSRSTFNSDPETYRIESKIDMSWKPEIL